MQETYPQKPLPSTVKPECNANVVETNHCSLLYIFRKLEKD